MGKPLGDNTKYFLSILIPSAIAVTSWFMLNDLTIDRERANKLRDIKLQYVIEAYNKIVEVSHKPDPVTYKDHVSPLNEAFAAVQLFGTQEQINLAQQYMETAVSAKPVKLDSLLYNLRNTLREELNQEKVQGRVITLRMGDYSSRTRTDSVRNQ